MIGYYIIINLILFFVMGYDKRMAIKGRRRIPEANIFVVGLLGGALGGFLGMMTFHHKTQKVYFFLIFFIAFNLHIALIYLLLGKLLYQ